MKDATMLIHIKSQTRKKTLGAEVANITYTVLTVSFDFMMSTTEQ